MDLRTRPPRSIRRRLGGYVHLGRMIDKCRAMLAGTEGEYVYPCPLDHELLEFAGLTPEQFTEAVRTRTDAEVAEWFLANATRHSVEEIERWNERMLRREPDTPEKWEYFKQCRDAVDPGRTDITAWADLLDLEEGRPVTPRHPSEAGR